MIYVTTGTHPDPFDRLIAPMEEFAASTDEEVTIQAGTSEVPVHAAKRLGFVPWEDSLKYISAARVVVSHAGTGTLIDAIHHNVPLIVMPRLARHGEVANDHQLEIASRLNEQGRITLVNTAQELFAALRRDDLPSPMQGNATSNMLVQVLKESLDKIRVEKSRR